MSTDTSSSSATTAAEKNRAAAKAAESSEAAAEAPKRRRGRPRTVKPVAIPPEGTVKPAPGLPGGPADLHAALRHYFGFSAFKGNQEAIIRSLLDGHDTFVLMPTGGGKSLCYQLPALIMEGTAIVISPLIALMKNQVDAVRNISETDHIAHFLNSSLSKAAIEQVKADILAGCTKLLYVAPESLNKEENVEFLRSVPISFYAIDEAHCISEWGHDFRPEYRRIRPIINEIGPRPVIALTATATPKVQHDIQKNLGMEQEARVFKSSFNRANLFYEIRPKTANVDRDLIKFIKDNEGKSGIVYCLSRKKVEELAEMLQVNGVKARPYHAGMDSASRSANQDAFLQEQADVIVATIAFGMGIDKPDVRFVIHYDMPKSLEGYYQETGRAGRDGGEGHCLTFYASKDLQRMEKFMQGKPVGEQEIGRQLLQETASYAESSVCRRKSLLYYFGEDYASDNCGSCDNCVSPGRRSEARDSLCAAIETVEALKENFKADHVIDVMTGCATSEVKAHGHDKLEVFGCQEGRDERYLNAVIRQAIIAGYLCREIENYGLLKVTPAGQAFLKKPGSFTIVEDRKFEDDSQPAEVIKSGASCAADPELYGIIKELRKEVAKRLSLPTHIIFQDQSLEAMATTYPITIDELKTLPGVGEGKARRYGKEFVDVIARYVEYNEIERLVDMRIYNMPNKSKQKIAIVQAIDRKVPLDEVARSKGLTMDELIEEMESIVYSGTRINITYHLLAVMDEEAVDDVFDYFKESESDAISEALEEFGDEFTEEELRLVRIKFISDMGN